MKTLCKVDPDVSEIKGRILFENPELNVFIISTYYQISEYFNSVLTEEDKIVT